jgi:DNA-binding transcriptional MerR regulator
MDASIPDKAYFRIGEASIILGVAPYVVRYWESEFKNSVRPIRTTSDQRLYKRKDLEMLMVIKKLLYVDHFTILGARRQLAKLKDGKMETDSEEYSKRLATVKNLLQQVKDMLQ